MKPLTPAQGEGARDGWSPEAYGRFKGHRTAPFDDLLRLVSPCPGGTVLDLGCGTGVLTATAHERLQAHETLGLDSSEAMLSSGTPRRAGLSFAREDIASELPSRTFDRVISNSAFNWIPSHASYWPRVASLVKAGGELAVQMPSNPDSAFSQCALEVAEAFKAELGGFTYRSPVERPAFYAELLARDGRVAESKVGTWLYPQLHESSDGIAAFAQGGLLSAYRARLQPADFERFVDAYRKALRARLGDGPVFFPFQRVFVWARFKA